MKIEIFGPGCPKCEQVERVVKVALSEMGITAEVEKVKDMSKIVEAGIMLTPGLRINGEIKCSGKIPTVEEVKGWVS